MNKLAGAARQLAIEAVEAITDPAIIADFEQALAEGDELRESGAFKDAINKYKDALSIAESA